MRFPRYSERFLPDQMDIPFNYLWSKPRLSPLSHMRRSAGIICMHPSLWQCEWRNEEVERRDNAEKIDNGNTPCYYL